MRRAAFETLDLSDRRKVFAVSDVHGMFGMLEEKLEVLGWDPALDSLIIIGDLVDRGPDSIDALDWIRRPNVHRVLGNHEEIAEAIADGDVPREEAVAMGAAWIHDMETTERRRIANLLMDAPVAIQVRTPSGHDVGFVHADCPSEWEWVRTALTDPSRGDHRHMIATCLWSRSQIDPLLKQIEKTSGYPTMRCGMSGIDHVFHGHSIVGRAFAHDDRSWIDTGAATRGSLTVVDVDTWLNRIHERRTFS